MIVFSCSFGHVCDYVTIEMTLQGAQMGYNFIEWNKHYMLLHSFEYFEMP